MVALIWDIGEEVGRGYEAPTSLKKDNSTQRKRGAFQEERERKRQSAPKTDKQIELLNN